MTYGAIFQCRESRAHQSGPEASARKPRAFGSGCGHGAAVEYLKATGLPVFARGTGTRATGTDTGTQDCVYRKTSAHAGRGITRASARTRSATKRTGDPSPGGLSLPPRRAKWLIASHDRKRLNWNIFLIGCWGANWPKPTNSWFRTKYGSRENVPMRKGGR